MLKMVAVKNINKQHLFRCRNTEMPQVNFPCRKCGCSLLNFETIIFVYIKLNLSLKRDRALLILS